MKVITEAILRNELKRSDQKTYSIPQGKILSPAAREYLQQRKIKIEKHKDVESYKEVQIKNTPVVETPQPVVEKPKYVDYETGAFYLEKPEFMTQLYGNVLVAKDHPRIAFRGKLDSLQALIVLNQTIILDNAECSGLVEDLKDILRATREIMRCDVLEEVITNENIIGLDHKQLREQSHHPMKYFSIKQMVLPDYSLGKTYALLNQIRTAVREAEVAGIAAFRQGAKITRVDIVEELNRLSSALHILMCKYLAEKENKAEVKRESNY